MQTQYHPLLTLRFHHPYFSDGDCPAVTATPDTETQRLMNALNIHPRPVDSGLDLFYGTVNEDAQLLTATDSIHLRFLVTAKDSLFYNYSDLTSPWQERRLPVFSNEDDPAGNFSFPPAAYRTEENPQSTVAIITLLLNPADESGIVRNGAVEPAAFTLTFPVRETIWRYHVIDNSEPGFEDFKLLADDDTIVAEAGPEPETRTLPDGTKAVVLSTPTPLPLQQRPDHSFQLSARRGGDAAAAPTILHLPAANADRITSDNPEAPEQFFSDIFIYL